MSETNDLPALFASRGLKARAFNGWWLVDGLFPALRLRDEDPLTVDIAFDETRVVRETYDADYGLDAFADGVLPVLLSAYWGGHDPNIVIRSVIKRPDGPWQLLTGRYLRTIEFGERPPVPYGFFGAIEGFLRGHRLHTDTHWLSVLITVTSAGAEAEIRLDGQRQPDLEAAIAALDWVYDGRGYTVRNAVLISRI